MRRSRRTRRLLGDVVRRYELALICHDCVGDPFLASEVREDGCRDECTYCGETREVVSLDDLASRIDPVLQEHFDRSYREPRFYEYSLVHSGLWDPFRGDVDEAIASIACLDDDVGRDVRDLLSDRYAYAAHTDGAENPYEIGAEYVEKEPDDSEFQMTWASFRYDIRSRTRFFSTDAEQALRDMFGNLSAHVTIDGTSAIREIRPEHDDRFFWRARKAHSADELTSILKDPAREMGPPPSSLARGGRMNAGGIPVFYGALDESTCVAETRPPVGSHVVIARFELLRPVRLLDFDALAEVLVEGSHFDPEYAARAGRAAFFRRLVREVTLPVMPQDEEAKYLATQVVAEYLANKVEPRLDGILFRSTQTDHVGQNVVLFNHACHVLRAEPSLDLNVTVEVPRSGEDPDRPFSDEIVVFEEPAADPNPAEPGTPLGTVHRDTGPSTITEPIWNLGEVDDDETTSRGPPTLQLDSDSVFVLEIKGVTYSSKRLGVKRFRMEKDEELEF